MSPADIVVLLLVAAAIVCAVVHSVRARKKRGGGCGCGCSGCTTCDKNKYSFRLPAYRQAEAFHLCKVENCEIFAPKYVLIWIGVCAILC